MSDSQRGASIPSSQDRRASAPKTWTRTPNTKIGVETSSVVTMRTELSTMPSLRSAAIVPIRMPTTVSKTTAITVRRIVTGARSTPGR